MKFIPKKEKSRFICPKDTVVGDVYHYKTDSNVIETLLRVGYSGDPDKIFFLLLSSERLLTQGNLIYFSKTRNETHLTSIDGELIMYIEGK